MTIKYLPRCWGEEITKGSHSVGQTLQPRRLQGTRCWRCQQTCQLRKARLEASARAGWASFVQGFASNKGDRGYLGRCALANDSWVDTVRAIMEKKNTRIPQKPSNTLTDRPSNHFTAFVMTEGGGCGTCRRLPGIRWGRLWSCGSWRCLESFFKKDLSNDSWRNLTKDHGLKVQPFMVPVFAWQTLLFDAKSQALTTPHAFWCKLEG